MAGRVLLHIGAPKAGTTFLQTILWKNRESLGAQGLLVPGKRRFDFNLAARSVTTKIPDTGSGKRRPPAIAAWEAIVDETLQWPGDVVISNEWFAPASREQAERAISHWGLDQVHIVFTARAFVYQVPAAWQEKLKLGEGQSLADFTAGLDSGDQRWSWRTLDPADVLSRWGRMLPAEHVHVVTVPPRGSERELLWEALRPSARDRRRLLRHLRRPRERVDERGVGSAPAAGRTAVARGHRRGHRALEGAVPLDPAVRRARAAGAPWWKPDRVTGAHSRRAP